MERIVFFIMGLCLCLPLLRAQNEADLADRIEQNRRQIEKVKAEIEKLQKLPGAAKALSSLSLEFRGLQRVLDAALEKQKEVSKEEWKQCQNAIADMNNGLASLSQRLASMGDKVDQIEREQKVVQNYATGIGKSLGMPRLGVVPFRVAGASSDRGEKLALCVNIHFQSPEYQLIERINLEPVVKEKFFWSDNEDLELTKDLKLQGLPVDYLLLGNIHYKKEKNEEEWSFYYRMVEVNTAAIANVPYYRGKIQANSWDSLEEQVKIWCSNQRERIQIALVVDVTGSMKDQVNEVKKRLINYLVSLKKFPRSNRFQVDLAIIPFRDRVEIKHKSYLSKFESFSNAKSKIDFLDATGGGGWPEYLYGAVYHATQLPWTDNADHLILIITDAGDNGSFYEYPPEHRLAQEDAILATMNKNELGGLQKKLEGKLQLAGMKIHAEIPGQKWIIGQDRVTDYLVVLEHKEIAIYKVPATLDIILNIREEMEKKGILCRAWLGTGIKNLGQSNHPGSTSGEKDIRRICLQDHICPIDVKCGGAENIPDLFDLFFAQDGTKSIIIEKAEKTKRKSLGDKTRNDSY